MSNVIAITRHFIRNYGSVLQAFATQELIEDAGHDCQFVDYRQPGVADKARSYFPHTAGVPVKALAYRLLRARGARARGVRFENFLQEHIRVGAPRYCSPNALQQAHLPEDAHYLVGSDQVWNVEYNRDNGPYYLDFAPACAQRFSLASSIGMQELPPTEEERLHRALQSFSGISVREQSAADYLNALGLKAVRHVDPTLARTPAQWDAFASAVQRHPMPFLLVYQLNTNPKLVQASTVLAKHLGIPVVRIEYWQTFRGRGAKTIMRPTVAEFVACFRDATFVVTDSFHGAAFSINYGKEFVAMLPPKYGTRIDSLLEQFDLTDRRVSSVGEALEVCRQGPVPTNREAKLQAERAAVRDYLAAQLSSDLHLRTPSRPTEVATSKGPAWN